MEIAVFVVVAIAFVAIISYAVHLSEKAKQKRLDSLFDFCSRSGFEFSPFGRIRTTTGSFLWMNYDVHTDTIVETFKFHPLFQKGHSQKAAPLMTKAEQGVEWLLFDYRYLVTTSNGKTTTTSVHDNSVAIARVPYEFPMMTITPQNFFLSLGKVLGVHELETESVAFNDKFFVKTDDHKRATEILVPEVLEFLVQKQAKYWHWNGPYLITYLDRHATADEYENMFEELKFLISSVPNYYKHDHS